MRAPADDVATLARRTAVATAVAIGVAACLVGLGYVVDVVLIGFAGLLVAILLRGLAHLVARATGVSSGWALAIVAGGLAVATAGAWWWIVPTVAEQAGALREALPRAVTRLEETLSGRPWGRWLIAQAPAPQDMIPQREDMLTRITGVVSTTLGALGTVLLIVVMGLYLAAQPRAYVEGFVRLFPPRTRPRVRGVLRDVGETLQWWLAGKLAAMAFIGVLTWVGLMLLGVRMAMTLALIAGLLTFVPNIGPIVAAVPAVLLALLQGPTTALWVTGLYVAVQTLESYVVTPMIQQRAVSLPPGVILVAQLVMGVLIGTLGLALATPLAAAVAVVVRTTWVEPLERRAGAPAHDVADAGTPESARSRRTDAAAADDAEPATRSAPTSHAAR